MSSGKRQNNSKNLTGILEGLSAGSEGEHVTIGQIVQQFKYRGFGPLLLVPALIVLLPTGAIPLVPALCGVVTGFVCLQMLVGREHPWIPKRIGQFSVPKATLEKSVRWAKPYTQKIDRVLHYKRLNFLVNEVSKRLTAAFCFVLCMIMTAIGFIPMLPATLALPIFFFGLGYIAHDGLVIAIGFLAIFGSGLGVWYFWDAY